MTVEEVIIAVTGHRPHKLGHEYDGDGPYSNFIRQALQEQINILKPTKIITGMALGVDTIWAELAIANNIPFEAAIPFEGYELRWPPKSQIKFHQILNHKLCTKKYVSEGGFAAWKMFKRNEYMVDNSTILVAVWDGTSGGTQSCHDYAFKKGAKIIRIIPKKVKATRIAVAKM